MKKEIIITVLEFIVVAAVLSCWIFIHMNITDLIALVAGVVAFVSLERLRQ